MGVRPFKKQDKKIHSDVVIIGRARNTRYDYRPRIQLAFAQGRIDWLEKLQQSLFDDMRYCSDADMSFIGMQIKVTQDCIDKIMKQNQKPFEMHVENNYNNFDNMSAEEKAAFIRSLNQGTQIGQQNNIFGGNNTLNYNEKPKDEPQFVDAPEVKTDGVADSKDDSDEAVKDEADDAKSPFEDKDERVRFAIKVVMDDPNFGFNGDWAWIKKAMEGEPIKEVRSAEKFIAYMKKLGAIRFPVNTTITRNLTKIDKKVDGFYQFTDTSDHDEIRRRNNIMKEFVAAYTKYKK